MCACVSVCVCQCVPVVLLWTLLIAAVVEKVGHLPHVSDPIHF